MNNNGGFRWSSFTDRGQPAFQDLARSSLFTLSVFLLSGPTTLAQQSAPNALSDPQLVPHLLQRIDALEKRTQQLENAKSVPTTSQSPSPRANVAETDGSTGVQNYDAAISREVAAHEDHGMELFGGLPTLRLRGFGDVQYRINDEHEEKNAFALGQLDLFLTSRVAEGLNTLGEFVFEGDEDHSFTFETERLLLQSYTSEYLTLRVGPYHSVRCHSELLCRG
ncbi:MAG: hypothetical protein AB7G75_18235 [Candidatus Binatia bacterium]